MTVRVHPYGTEQTVIDNFQSGDSATDTWGLFGVTPIAQQSNSALATLTATSATAGGFGFTASAQFEALMAQVKAITSALKSYGVITTV
jgi:hypothetical protein